MRPFEQHSPGLADGSEGQLASGRSRGLKSWRSGAQKRRVALCALVVTSALYAEPGQCEAFRKEFSIVDPFPTDASINALKTCYPSIPWEQASRLRYWQKLSYIERQAGTNEASSSTCSSRGWSTFFSERMIEIRMPDLSSTTIDKQLAPQAKDECEERKAFGNTVLHQVTTRAVVFKTPAYYRTRSCHWLFGKNDKYKWEGALIFTFRLQEVFEEQSAAPNTAPTRVFKGHTFLQPQVDIEKYSDEVNYWHALVDPKTLIGVLVGGLLFGPGGAAVLGSIGAGIAVTELAAIDNSGPRAESAARAEAVEIIRKLIDEDVMKSLSQAVNRAVREIESFPPPYALQTDSTGFVAGRGSEIAYRFKDVGSYCSVRLSSQLREREQTQQLIEGFQKCEATSIKVARGDSLWRLAQRHIGDGYAYLYLAARNGMKPDAMLKVGEPIVIPSRCDICESRNQGTLVLRHATLDRMAKNRGQSPSTWRRADTVSGKPDLIYPYEVVIPPDTRR